MRYFLIFAAAATLAAATAWADDGDQKAHDGRHADHTLDLIALNLARVTVNEAGWDSPDDAGAIWQTQYTVAGGRNASPAAVLRAQRALSGRVTGAREPLDRGNERWTRNLRWNNREPEGWATATTVPWERYMPRWERIREALGRMVRAHFAGRVRRFCDGHPYAWGGRDGLDDHIMARRNEGRIARGLEPMRPLDCGETENVFFGLERPR